MLRTVLMGVLAFSAASACKGKGDAPAVQPGVAVGKVVEASGDVSATRGADKRVLASGQDISGDDVIETGAGANVRIRFAHNNATWELGPNKKQLVSESLAWKAPKADTPAGEVNEATLAAGRHAERETVTTGTTAPSEAPAAVAAAAPAPGSAPIGGGVPADEPDMMAKGGGGGGGSTEDRKTAPRGAKQQKKETAVARGGEVANEKDVADKDATRSMNRESALRAQDDGVAPPPPPPPPPSPVTAPSPGAPSPDPASSSDEIAQDMIGDVRIAMNKHRLALAKCVTNTESRVKTISIPIVVSKGKAQFVFSVSSTLTAAQKTCLGAVAAKLSFPANYDLKTKYDLSY
jgi:hypothetical protein